MPFTFLVSMLDWAHYEEAFRKALVQTYTKTRNFIEVLSFCLYSSKCLEFKVEKRQI